MTTTASITTYDDEIPARVRVLVLGGGIHGTGLLHDMASRGWRDIHLVEKRTLGFGTSSRSTKLIHGGLRYLKRLSDFGLVSEALRERRLLMNLAPDLVRPVELLFPILKHGGMPRFMVKTGLTLYDRLAGKYRLEPHRTVPAAEVADKAPILNQDLVGPVYSFWDGQTDDLGLVARVAASARQLGAGITEGCAATRLTPIDDGWSVEVQKADGTRRTISALYVVNAVGPWANSLMEASGIAPTHRAMNNKGAHLLFDDIGLKAGLFLQSAGDGRIFFLLPWQGHTLLGTTEDLYDGDPDAVGVSEADIVYLLENCNKFLKTPLQQKDIVKVFAGLRWLAVEAGHGISDTSRHYVIGERASKRGLLLTLYGGKLTTYRNLSQTIGDRITRHFGEFRASRTTEADAWVAAAQTPALPRVVERFPSPA
jgi:glycerol-3-phosphate dehydrogenase